MIDKLLTQSDTETDEQKRRQFLVGAAVAGAYIKRYGNLLLISERMKNADIRDLKRCFEDSFANLELLGVNCLHTLPPKLTLVIKDMLYVYRSFEEIIEACLYDLHHVWVSARESEGWILLFIECVCDTDDEVQTADGEVYIEAIFSDVTELYAKRRELQKQSRELKRMYRELKTLSDNVLEMTREQEILNLKSRLHDQMNMGVSAIRQILQQDSTSEENDAAIIQFRRAIQVLQEETAYPQDDVSDFIKDAAVSGVQVSITGELPKEEELLHRLLPVMRESCVNAARHADAQNLYITAERMQNTVTLRITNDGKQPEGEIKPQGGLVDLVLMDVCTHGAKDGIDAAAELRRLFPNLKIIVVTSMVEESYIKRARAAGVDSFWYKETSPEDLITVMDATMQGENKWPNETPAVKLGVTTSDDLTETEIKVLRLVCEGLEYNDIAKRLNYTKDTVKYHIRNILQKTGYANKTQLAIAVTGKRYIIPKLFDEQDESEESSIVL